MTKKNKALPSSELPEWLKALPPAERGVYLHSPQCRVCTAKDSQGRPLRAKVETMVLEGKSYAQICNVMRDEHGATILPDSVSRHMERHAPTYVTIVERMMSATMEEVISGAYGAQVDQYRVARMVMEKGYWEALASNEEVPLPILLKAAEAFDKMTKDIVVPHEGLVSQEDINILLDIIQTVMTPEQRNEVRRRFSLAMAAEAAKAQPSKEALPLPEADVVVEDDGSTIIEVDGEMIDVSEIPTLPPEDEGGDVQ